MNDASAPTTPRQAPGNSERVLIRVKDLNVSAGQQTIIENLNLTVMRGEILALVGESGCGKSVTARALAQLLPSELRIASGAIEFNGENIIEKTEHALNQMRGSDISMLFQQPHMMLDPTSRVHSQISESLRQHRNFSRQQAFARVIELLKEVGIGSPRARARSFSHELSGGMAQRVMIAAALAADPKLLIADEPTTALDVTVQVKILHLLKREQTRRHFSILLITHDLAIVSAVADRVAVMYGGRIVEQGTTDAIIRTPTHPYTRALIRCSLLVTEADGRLMSIPGSGTQGLPVVQGCRFAPRCSLAGANSKLLRKCSAVEPQLRRLENGSKVRCHAVSTDTRATGT